MQLADLNSKPRGGKSLRNLIDCSIGARFYPLPGSVHYQILHLYQFHGPTYINCDQKKKSNIKNTQNPMHAIVLQNPVHIRSKKTVHS